VLPKSLTFRFDMLDDEEDKAKTDLDGARIDNVVKLFTVPSGMAESVIDRLEARRLLADVQVLPEEFLANEPDVTPDVVADDVEREDGNEEVAPVPTEPMAEEVAAKELRRLYGPPARYSSKNGRVTVLEPRHPFVLAAAQAAKAKATPKTGASRTRDVALPDDIEERTQKLERSMEAAASAGLAKVEKLLTARVRALPEARKAEGEKAVPLADDDDLWEVVEGLFVDALGPELTAAAQAGAAARGGSRRGRRRGGYGPGQPGSAQVVQGMELRVEPWAHGHNEEGAERCHRDLAGDRVGQARAARSTQGAGADVRQVAGTDDRHD